MSTQPTDPPSPGSHYQPSLGVVLAILVVFVAGAYLMLRSPHTGPATPTSTTVRHSSSRRTATTVAKSQVRVQVANGTTVPNLARQYTQQLLTLGWDTLPQLNGPRVTATIIYFNPNFQWAAREIATELKFPPSSVRALNGQIPVTGAASDDVVIVLGPNAAVAG